MDFLSFFVMKQENVDILSGQFKNNVQTQFRFQNLEEGNQMST